MKMIGLATFRRSSPNGWLRGIRDRRGVVAVLVGLMAPVLVMALGLGIEVSRWSVAELELQRIADAAALAGAFDYEHQATPVPQTAAAAAVNLAQLNGITAPVTAQITPGPEGLDGTVVQVTVSRQLPLFLAGIFTAATSLTISASAVAELISAPTGTACMLALQGSVNGVTPPVDTTLKGNASVSGSNCVLRSNGDVKMNGNVDVAAGIVAAGVVTISGNAAVKKGSTITQNAGQIQDPFASDTALTNALTQANQVPADANAVTCSGNCTVPSGCCEYNQTANSLQINPGSYSSINVSGNVTLTLAPGLYLVGQGGVSFTGNAAVTANGVTIVAAGTGTFNGNAAANFTAATTATAGNNAGAAIPGVLFATSSTGGASFGGNASFPFTGAIYVPNGTLTITGNASDNTSDGTPGCGEVVAFDVALSGNAQFASNCSAYGLPAIPSQLTTTAELVQ